MGVWWCLPNNVASNHGYKDILVSNQDSNLSLLIYFKSGRRLFFCASLAFCVFNPVVHVSWKATSRSLLWSLPLATG